jgi:hypothetical protein
VEIFRAEDYELVKRTVLSDGPEFDVPEQGALHYPVCNDRTGLLDRRVCKRTIRAGR